jgi:hypothetical protein
MPARRDSEELPLIRRASAVAFTLSASWMIVFSQQWFWLALAIIWGALAALLWAVHAATRASPGSAAQDWRVRWPLGLHAGWVSLAAFLNTAQVIVAYELLPTDRMLPWSLALWAGAGALLLVVNRHAHAHLAYPLAALWGLAGVVVQQRATDLPGADVSATVAVLLALALAAQTAWLRLRRAGPLGRSGRQSSPATGSHG